MTELEAELREKLRAALAEQKILERDLAGARKAVSKAEDTHWNADQRLRELSEAADSAKESYANALSDPDRSDVGEAFQALRQARSDVSALKDESEVNRLILSELRAKVTVLATQEKQAASKIQACFSAVVDQSESVSDIIEDIKRLEAQLLERFGVMQFLADQGTAYLKLTPGVTFLGHKEDLRVDLSRMGLTRPAEWVQAIAALRQDPDAPLPKIVRAQEAAAPPLEAKAG